MNIGTTSAQAYSSMKPNEYIHTLMSGKWIEVSTVPQAFENPFAYRSGNKRNRNGKLTENRITKAISNEMARVEQIRATSWQTMSVTQLKQRSAVASTTDLDGAP
jgi:hypothetical protein